MTIPSLLQQLKDLRSPYNDSYVARQDVLRIVENFFTPKRANGKHCIMNMTEDEFDLAWAAIQHKQNTITPCSNAQEPELTGEGSGRTVVGGLDKIAKAHYEAYRELHNQVLANNKKYYPLKFETEKFLKPFEQLDEKSLENTRIVARQVMKAMEEA